MGEVFLCRQLKMGGRLVAVKVLSDTFASSRVRLDMLRDEALALARLRHPGVVDVYEFIVGLDPDDDSTIHAFAMQWIQGCSLAQWFAVLTRPQEAHGGSDDRASSEPSIPSAAMAGQPPLRFACRLIAAVARTLYAVHHAGLLHRDLKPSNILLREDGSALLTDFGLARDLRSEVDSEPSMGFSGTRAFASPEQRRGEALDVRSDVYSLGVTLRHVLFEPIPADLGAIITKATSPSADDRYPTAADFAEDIERFIAHKPVRANPPGPLRRCAMFIQRNRRATLGTTLGAACALLIAALIVIAVFIAPRQAEKHLTRARLELLTPGHANVVWNAEWFGVRDTRFDLDRKARGRAVAAYRDALRWRPWGNWNSAVRRELSVVEQGTAPDADDRLMGLAAYLAGDGTGAVNAWARLAAREDPDAFIDAALGVVYLIREQHALAYPRLEHACRAFPRVAFLTVYHADAAVGCGDLDRAERLLAESEHFDNQDNHHSTLRVRGDLLLARGRLDEAYQLILYATLEPTTFADAHRLAASPSEEQSLLLRYVLESPIAAIRIARIRSARGDLNGAVSAMGTAFAWGPGPAAIRDEYARHVDRWWRSQNDSGRRHAIRRSLDLHPDAPESLTFRLRHANTGSIDSLRNGEGSANQPPFGREGPSRRSLLSCLLEDFVALGSPDSHTSLEDAPHSELARRMEVWNMERWNTLPTYSPILKDLQLAAWASPTPRTTSELCAWLRRASVRATRSPTTDEKP
jgi:serine/threonine protein kinase